MIDRASDGRALKILNIIECLATLIARDSPQENGYIESCNRNLRDELLNREIFMTLEEASVLIVQWRREYNRLVPTAL